MATTMLQRILMVAALLVFIIALLPLQLSDLVHFIIVNISLVATWVVVINLIRQILLVIKSAMPPVKVTTWMWVGIRVVVCFASMIVLVLLEQYSFNVDAVQLLLTGAVALLSLAYY